MFICGATNVDTHIMKWKGSKRNEDVTLVKTRVKRNKCAQEAKIKRDKCAKEATTFTTDTIRTFDSFGLPK